MNSMAPGPPALTLVFFLSNITCCHMSTPNSKEPISSSDVRCLLMAYSGHGRELPYKQVGRTAWTPTAYHLGGDTTGNYDCHECVLGASGD